LKLYSDIQMDKYWVRSILNQSFDETTVDTNSNSELAKVVSFIDHYSRPDYDLLFKYNCYSNKIFLNRLACYVFLNHSKVANKLATLSIYDNVECKKLLLIYDINIKYVPAKKSRNKQSKIVE
jgi:hypothetical protein